MDLRNYTEPRPVFVSRDSTSKALYKAEDTTAEFIKRLAYTWAKFIGLVPDVVLAFKPGGRTVSRPQAYEEYSKERTFWYNAIPQVLYDLLDRFGAGGYVAAKAYYLKNRHKYEDVKPSKPSDA